MSTENSRTEQMQKIQKEGLNLFEKKNKDYGDCICYLWSHWSFNKDGR